ncbi:MAG TPA: 30S ribosomal protein S4 [Thermoplasmata archaeon]|nr:30S ribosomal protein S4 [Thermoplasmata archaeon]
MGDPKFLRRTYDTPKHPWEAGRMAEERKLLAKYGLKNKRELWKAQSILRRFRGQARELQARLRAGETQAERETTLLLARLTRLGVLPVGSPTIDDVLALTTEDVLQRRFEWIVFTRSMAPTPFAARQWIVHGHFSIGDHRMTRPGYLVPSNEEGAIAYTPTSPYASDDHSVRVALRDRLQSRPTSAQVEATPAEGPGGA